MIFFYGFLLYIFAMYAHKMYERYRKYIHSFIQVHEKVFCLSVSDKSRDNKCSQCEFGFLWQQDKISKLHPV
jgi:hypothetical protein